MADIINDSMQAMCDHQNIVLPRLQEYGFWVRPITLKEKCEDEWAVKLFNVNYYKDYSNFPITCDLDGRVARSEELINRVIWGIHEHRYSYFHNIVMSFLSKPGGSLLSCFVVPVRVLYHMLVGEDKSFMRMEVNSKEGTTFLTIPFDNVMEYCRRYRYDYWWLTHKSPIARTMGLITRQGL